MLKEFFWNTFIHTGSFDAYFAYKEMESKSNALTERRTAQEEVATSNT